MKLRMFHTPSIQIKGAIESFNGAAFNSAIQTNVTLERTQRDILEFYISQSPSERRQIMNEVDLRNIIDVFYFLVNKNEHPDIIQNVVFLLDEFILAEENRIALFAERDACETIELCGRLVRQMKNDNIALVKYSIEVLTLLTSTCTNKHEFTGVMSDYFQHVRNVFTTHYHDRHGYQIIHLYNWSLFVLLNKIEYRKVFAREIPLERMVELYDRLAGIQDNDLIYSVFHIFWLMTFDMRLIEDQFPERCIAVFASVLLKIKIEKIIRIVMMTLHNLITVDWYVRLLVQHEFNLILPVLLSRQFSDGDIVGLLQEVNEVVEKKLTETSSMECYLDELKSGRMRWSPMHRSEQFWTENVTQFELDNWGLVRKLKTVINDKSIDPICISVACFDLGEVARYHPLGRKIMNDLGIKLDLLQLTNHENAEIKKNAIYAVQKIMLHHWDLVQND